MVKQSLGGEIVRVQGNKLGGFVISVGKKNKLFDFCNKDEKDLVSFATQKRKGSCGLSFIKRKCCSRRFAF